MSEFYFSVGEEVILQSKNKPHLNGEATVLSRFMLCDRGKCPHCGIKLKQPEDKKVYHLSIKDDEDCCIAWAEVALRKKHEPGQSFDSLMSSLNIKVN